VSPTRDSAAAAESLVGEDRVPGDPDRAEAAGQRAERGADLLGLRRADVGRRGGVDQLLLVQRVVAADQDQGERAVDEVDEGLDLAVGRGLVSGGEIFYGPHARRREGLGRGEHHGPFRRIIYKIQPGRGFF